MATFAQIAKGTRARKPVEIELPGGAKLACDLRPLNGAEEADVLKQARAFAAERGVKDPADGEPLYEVGRQVASLLTGCVDSESPADDPRPFFATAEQVLDLDRDRRVYLFERLLAWQDDCAPSPLRMGGEEFIAKVFEVADGPEDDDGPLASLRPVVRWSFTRTLARQFLASLTPKSPSGPDASADSASASSPSSQ